MQFLIEEVSAEQNEQITIFYKFACEVLGITDHPVLTFSPSLGTTSFGLYHPASASVTVATEGRHISDILRTFGHELVHHKQLTSGSNNTLEELEYEANAVAGMLMRDYNKAHPELFGLNDSVELAPDTLGDSQGAVADDTTRPSGPVELAELSNKTMAKYKRNAKSELRSVRRIDKQGNPFGYRIDYLHNPNKYENRRKGIKTAEKKLEAHYAPVQEEMTAGSGDVAGIGIGPDGEPGVDNRKKKTTNMFTRKTFKQFRKSMEKYS